MFFNFSLPTLSIILFAVAFVSVAIIASVYCRRLLAVAKKRKECDASPVGAAHALPPVAVVVYAFDEPESLTRTLQCLVAQEYAPGYKIIVVNDGASPDVNMAAGMMKAKHPNIYVTYTPKGARNVSRKKLAITLGVKAAEPGDIVMLTDANATIDSPLWIASMARHFANPDTKLVLGYGLPECPRKVTAFDAMADSATWLYAAICGHPYRGCGYNMAYRRSLFFDNNGFAQSLNLRNGDDDIFVYDVANSANTAVELSETSQTEHRSACPLRELRDFRASHVFTGRRLPKRFRRVMALCEWLVWVACGTSVAAAVIANPANGFGWIIAALLILSVLATVGYAWSKCAAALSVRITPLLLPLLALTRPLRNALVRLRLGRLSHYSWQ